jgi:hypothetical protein
MPQPVPLSVVVATTRSWPEVRGCLDSLLDQAARAGAEVIVADGDGHGLPDDPGSTYRRRVVAVTMPGASVFTLRREAMRHARGDVVAMTEDHCRVTPDWCARIIQAHARRPDAAAIGGAVDNGATASLVDWASFFIVNGAAMPPLRSGEHDAISLQANLSYKRRVLPGGTLPPGRLEWMFNRELRACGERLVRDDRIVVQHVQSLGLRGTCAIHFHDGRSIAGFRLRAGMPVVERAARLAACFAMPPLLLGRTVLPLLAKRRRLAIVAASVPVIALLVCFRAAGALVGLLAGPGDSPRHIR